MMYKDTISYLPDDILCKVDRAAMSNSLETRAPFLDHRVVEMAWNMPMHMKIRGQESKWALRQILYKYVPPELVNRPKAGFAIPSDQWLTTSLKDWAEDLLDEKKLKEQGFLNYSTIRKAWLEHQKGRRNNTEKLWNILMFQAWLHN